MAKKSTRILIDSDIKAAAAELFKDLGLDLSTAVNMFLHQCVLRGEIPFSMKPLEAMEEAKRISSDPSVKGYSSMEELKAALDS